MKVNAKIFFLSSLLLTAAPLISKAEAASLPTPFYPKTKHVRNTADTALIKDNRVIRSVKRYSLQ